jgi:hypothetical protein
VTEENPAELEKAVAHHADEMEDQADDMERRSSELAEDVSDARDHWERKRRDPSVPGAPEPEGDASSEDAPRAPDEDSGS